MTDKFPVTQRVGRRWHRPKTFTSGHSADLPNRLAFVNCWLLLVAGGGGTFANSWKPADVMSWVGGVQASTEKPFKLEIGNRNICGNDPVNGHDPLGLESHGDGADATYNFFRDNEEGFLMLAADITPVGPWLPGYRDRSMARAKGMARLALTGSPGASLIVPGQKEFEKKLANDFTGGEGNTLAAC